MNNGAALNRTTINGWLGNTTIRVQVIAFAMATGSLVARAWRRDVVDGKPAVTSAEGRVWRRAPAEMQAVAESTIGFNFFRWIRLNALAEAYAEAVITAISKPPTNVTLSINAVASTSAVMALRTWFRSATNGVSEAAGSVATRVFAKLSVNGEAIATGGIDTSVYRQLQWDEYALPEYTFIVQPETKVFYVVS